MENRWVKNKKTGKLYKILYETAIDATNNSDKIFVIYTDNSSPVPFVREKNEFLEKFEEVK